jgi:hypothetical protein
VIQTPVARLHGRRVPPQLPGEVAGRVEQQRRCALSSVFTRGTWRQDADVLCASVDDDHALPYR